jgi:hypothetical protein
MLHRRAAFVSDRDHNIPYPCFFIAKDWLNFA